MTSYSPNNAFTLFLFLHVMGIYAYAAGADPCIAKLNNVSKVVDNKVYYLLILRSPLALSTDTTHTEYYINGSMNYDKYLVPTKNEVLPGTFRTVEDHLSHRYLWMSPSDNESIELYSVVFTALNERNRESLLLQAKKNAFSCKFDDLLVITVKSNNEIPEAMEKSHLDYQERAKQREAKEIKQK